MKEVAAVLGVGGGGGEGAGGPVRAEVDGEGGGEAGLQLVAELGVHGQGISQSCTREAFNSKSQPLESEKEGHPRC